MKTKLILIVFVLTGSAFLFSGCKKSGSNPAGPALTPQQVSSQVALNIQQTLYNGFGAFSISNGLNAPGTLGVIPGGRLTLNAPGNPLCGAIVDTTLNYSTSANGVTASVKGDLKFAFNCTGTTVSGFNVTDNLAIAESTSSFSVSYTLAEDLTLTAQTPGSGTSDITFSGTLSLGGNFNYTSGSKGTGSQNFSYTFNSIVIDSSGNILSGSASFDTTGTGPAGVWKYSGTVTFLGNSLATITINGTSYNVNLQTGVVS